MIKIKFDPSGLTGKDADFFRDWEEQASQAQLKIILKWETDGKISSSDFTERIWRELKEWLIEHVFSGKCAYCETEIVRTHSHAEHFRPKAGISNKKEGERFQREKALFPDGSVSEHPGYFGLAYDWKNLLPSCNHCNTAQGKKNQFPVSRECIFLTNDDKGGIPSKKESNQYYPSTEQLDKLEGRELLHPYFDDPSEHIGFGVRGIEFPIKRDGENSTKGLKSIEVFNLDADELRRARSREQDNARRMYASSLGGAMSTKSLDELEREAVKRVICHYREESRPYIAAVKGYFSHKLKCAEMAGNKNFPNST